MATPLNLLLVEDSDDDAARLHQALSRGGFKANTRRVADRKAFQEALKGEHWDAVVCDIDHPRLRGQDALGILRDSDRDLPVILLAEDFDFAVAAEMMAAGAHDFIEKSNLERAVPALVREMRAASLRAADHATLGALKAQQARAAEIAALLPDIVYECDVDGRLTFCNDAAFDATGATPEALENGINVLDFIDASDAGRVRRNFGAILRGEVADEPREYTFRRGDGTTFPARIRSRVFYRDGKPAGLRGIIVDISDQKRKRRETEEALHQTQQNLEAILSLAPVVVWATDQQGRFTFSRGAGLNALGLGQNEVVGKSVFDVYRDHPDIVAAAEKALAGDEVKASHTLGGLVFEAHYRPILSESGAVSGVVGVAVDLTEKAAAQAALQASEERLRAVLDNSPAAIFLKDPDGRLILVNKAYEERHGASAEALLGKTAVDVFPEALAKEILERDRRVIAGEPAVNVEEVLDDETVPGGRRVFLVNRFAIPGRDGQVVASGGISTDVTDQKIAEEEVRRSRDELEARVAERTRELRERESILSALIDNSDSSIDLKDADGRFELINGTFETWHQVTSDTVIGRFLHEALPADAAAAAGERHRAVVDSGKAIAFELDRSYADGVDRHVLLTKFPVLDGNGRVIKVGSIATDVTDSKRAEIALRESEERFRTVIENSQNAIVLRDREGRILLANRAFCGHRHRSYAEIAGSSIEELYPPDHAAMLQAQHQRVLETGKSLSFEHIIPERAETGDAVIATRFPVRNADGAIIGVGTIATNITERRATEAALRESETRFRAFIDNSSTAISVLDRDGRFVVANKQLASWMADGDPADIVGKTVFDIFPADKAPLYAAQDERVMESGESEEIPYEWTHTDGKTHSYLAQKFPIRNDAGDIVGMGVISTDITELQQAETTIRESEERFRTFVENTPAIVGIVAPDRKLVMVNKEFARRHAGGNPNALLGKTIFDILPQEVAKQLDWQDRAVLRTGEPIDTAFSIVLPDGTEAHYQLAKFPLRDATGAITGIGFISTDLTARKRAEDEVKETARLLRAVLDNSPTSVSLKDTDGKLVLVNEQWRRQYNYADHEVIGKTLVDIFPYDVATELQAQDRRVIETGAAVEFEIELPGAEGLPETDIVTKFPITGPDGTITGVGSIGTNITERKRAEDALRWSERDLRGILDNMVDTFFRTDREGRIMMISPSVINLLGLTPEEALGRKLEDFIADPGSMPSLYDLVSSDTETTAGHEIRMRKPDGNEMWVLATARKFLDEDGEPAGIEGVAHDITMRKRAEEALAESESRFRDFAEASSDWMWECDAEGRYSYLSERILDVLGLRPDAAIGRTREELSEEGPASPDWDAYRHVTAERLPFRDFEYNLMNGDDEIRTVRVSGKPRFADDGTFLGYRGTGADITESLAAERREAETRRRFLDAIETVPVGFAMFDASDHIVLWNRLYETFSSPNDPLRAGMTFEEILRSGMTDNPIPGAIGQEEAWIAERVEKHRNPGAPLIIERGGRWLQIREHRSPDGSLLLVIVDVTDIRRAEESLRESERQFRAILDNIPDLAWLKDAANRIITVNNVFSQSSGLALDDLVGKTDLEIWPEELAQGYYADDQEVVETGLRKRIEEQIQLPSGDRVWVETIKAPVVDENGNVVGTVGTARDITERRNAEQALRKLSAAVEQSPATIFITDPEGVVEYANPKFFETTGFGPNEVIGRAAGPLTANDEESVQFEKMWESIASGSEWRGELRSRRKSGEYYWSSLAISPITDDAGRTTSYLGVGEDTTEKRRMDEQLRHAQKLEAVGTLAGGVAHDFNNILTGVLGHCYIAVEKLDPDNAVQFNLEQIRVASNRAKDLVQQLLAFSRRREAALQPVTLHGIVDEAVKLVHASIRSVIKIEWRFDENAGTVLADPNQIHQVLLNLCGNAADAIGDAAGVIDISVDRVVTGQPIAVVGANLPPGQYARLRISDTGCGMDSYTQSRAFDPFFTTKPVGSGTGLGLAAVHGIVQDHKGGIQLESKAGKGTTFNIYLPCVDIEETKAEPRVETDFSGAEHILLVDDERMVLQSIGPYLEHFGYKVEQFTSATTALTMFEANPDDFDLLVTDQVMPNMTGDVLARRVREIRPEMPIILCTGYAARGRNGASVAPEVDEIVGKPVEPSELGAIIRKVLDSRNR